MPRYTDLPAFLALARTANDHFEKHKNSALHALIALLGQADCSQLKILRALSTIAHAKIRKYNDAFLHLFSTYAGLHVGMLPVGPLREANAAKFPRTVMPPTYDPTRNQGKEIVVGTPPTKYLEQSCELFLLNSLETNGIVLIHLCKFQGPMNNVLNGRKVVDHINAVLRVAALLDIPVCALHMTADTPVCAELKDAYDAVPQKAPVLRVEGHMGSANQAFESFASTKDNVVVMGFDGTICVHANMFGCAEFKDPARTIPAPPLITLTNVITSRAVLVNDGVLYSKGSAAKPYGVLDLT